MRVALLGLGEAGGRLADDLEGAGCEVTGWDPVRQGRRAGSAVEAVTGAGAVLSVNAASAALEAAASVAGALDPEALYADLNTAAPGLKRELAAVVPVAFADVALVGTVPRHGLATPALASGPGAERFATLFRPLGMPVDVVGAEPGAAAGLKLLRSVFMKGIAAAALESLAAAEAAGAGARTRADLAEVLGEELLERLLTGSHVHARRRAEEMEAAVAYLEELGVPARVSAAAAGWLAQLRDAGPA
jgi:3-hydroxyisobutyrate dehydrogenase-like beta-hydroxyacid dehydrogenase